MRNRKREYLDFYKTPTPCVELIANRINNGWDSCSGDDVFREVLGSKIVKSSDINPRKIGVEQIDFLSSKNIPEKVKMVVINPPFLLAREFIEHSIFDLKLPIWALIRVEWLSTKKNCRLQQHLSEMQIISELIKFTTEDGRVINGNGTMRCAWVLFKPSTCKEKLVSFRYYLA